MIEILSDLFDIAQRLKEIDSGYKVFYNKTKSKFELHREERGRVSYLLTFPFDSLDSRAVEHCLRTRRERKEELLKEIEESNKKLEEKALYEAKKEAEKKAEEVLRES